MIKSSLLCAIPEVIWNSLGRTKVRHATVLILAAVAWSTSSCKQARSSSGEALVQSQILEANDNWIEEQIEKNDQVSYGVTRVLRGKPWTSSSAMERSAVDDAKAAGMAIPVKCLGVRRMLDLSSYRGDVTPQVIASREVIDRYPIVNGFIELSDGTETVQFQLAKLEKTLARSKSPR